MDRGNSKHSPRVDDEMAEEVEGTVRGTAGGRAEEFRESEPSGEDQPEASLVPDGVEGGVGTPQGMTPEEVEARSRMGRYLPRTALPGDREGLMRAAAELEAPDDVLDELNRLPEGREFRTVSDAWAALGHRNESQRW